MMDENEKKILAESQSAEVVNAETVAAEARERARLAQMDVYRAETTKSLSDALRDVFGEHASSGRFVDISRIPLICRSIVDFAASIKRIEDMISAQKVALDEKEQEADKRYVNQDQFGPVQKLVYGLVGLVLASVFAALIGLVVMNGR